MTRIPIGRPRTSSRASKATGWIAARLANRPDSEHEQAVVRLVIVTLLAVYFGTLAIVLPEAAAATFRHGAFFALGYVVLSVIYCAWIVAQPGVSRLRRLVAMVTDQTTLSVLLYLGGPWGGALYPIYLWITFGNGFRYGNVYLAASAGYSFCAFSVAAWLNPFWHSHIALTVGLALGLVMLPSYVATLIRKLTEAKRTAEAANRAKSRFLATMSHELRTPLNAVIGLSDLLGSTRLDREQADMVGTVGSSGRALLALINDILDLAKIEAGKAEVEAEDFDLVAELASSAAMLRPQAERKKVQLGLVVSADVPLRAHGDVRHLRQVLLNLLSNAIKFTDQGGVVIRADAKAKAGNQGHWLTLRVEDSGIGISDADQKRIFDAFTQSDDDANRQHGGTGLGLAIARQLAETMHGQLRVESAHGRGSTFTLELPLGPAHTPSAQSFETIRAVRLLAPGPASAGDLADLLPQVDVTLGTHDAGVLCLDLRGNEDLGGLIDPRLLGKLTATAAKGGGTLVIADVDTELPRRLAFALGDAVRLDAPVDAAGLRRALERVATLDGRTRQQSALAEELSSARPRRHAIVLVVEDNPVNRKVTAKVLERAGYTPMLASSGEEALDRLEEGGIDAVLMDVNMPGDSGIDTVKLFRFTQFGNSSPLPIIALTADATVETRDACLEAGMDDFITKPVDAVKLLRTLDRHLPSDAGEDEVPKASSTAADAPMEPDEPPALDRSSIATLQELDPSGGFLGEIVAEFVTDTELLLTEIEQGIAAGEQARVQDLLHALKSSAGNVGAAQLRARAMQIERQIRSAGVGNAPHAVALLRQDAEAYRVAIAPDLPSVTGSSASGGERQTSGAQVITLPGSSRMH